MSFFKKSILGLLFLGIFPLILVSFVSAGYGTTPAGAPICSNIVPGTPSIKTLQSVGGGSVEITWDGVTNATAWTVAYGVSSGKYIYGVHNFGDSISRGIKISDLPGGTYYFALRANNGCMPGPFSNEWVVTVGGGEGIPLTETPTTQLETGQTPQATGTIKPQITPKISPAIVTPTPTPQRPSLWLSIVNFFKFLFNSLLGR